LVSVGRKGAIIDLMVRILQVSSGFILYFISPRFLYLATLIIDEATLLHTHVLVTFN